MVARSVAHALGLSYMLSMTWVVFINHFRVLLLRMLWCLVVVIRGMHLRTYIPMVVSVCICIDSLHGGGCSMLDFVLDAAVVFPY
jgi:hypothetical protein